jgi:hypothetical protein
LARALDVGTPQLDILADEILADFAVDPPYGVAWWAPHPSVTKRGPPCPNRRQKRPRADDLDADRRCRQAACLQSSALAAVDL